MCTFDGKNRSVWKFTVVCGKWKKLTGVTMAKVDRIKLGSQGLEVSVQGLGCMGMSAFYGPPKNESDMIALVHHAIDSGVTFLDTSDVYGPHTNEILLGKVWIPAFDRLLLDSLILLLKCESADVVLIFAGQDERKESEGFDRQDLKLPDEHNRLIKAISRRNKNTAVIVQGGAPVEMLWEDNVKAILMCYFSGSCFGSALLNVLSGKVSPSGKLAETFPKRLNDVPSYEIYPDHSRAVYEEGCEVGYRYYNKRGIETNYPFGYGLSYTKFEFSHLTACLTDGKIETKCLVRNTGECAGSAVVQIYIKKSDEDNASVLATFDKIHLEAGEEKEVVLEIEPKYIASYNGEGNAYIFEKGEYELYAAHSSVEPACRTVLRVDEAIEYKFKIDSHAPRVESEDESKGISLNTTLRDLEKYKAMKPVIAFTKFIGEKVGTSLVPNGMVGELVMDTPLRQLPMGTDGAISMATVKKAVNTINSFIKREKKKDGNTGGMR